MTIRVPHMIFQLSQSGHVIYSASIPPDNVKSVVNNRVIGDTVDKFEITVVDPKGIEIEKCLIAGAKDIFFKYGDNVTSDLEFYGTVYDFDTTFVGNMCQVNMSGIASKDFAYTSKIQTRKKAWSEEGYTRPSDIVEAMCNLNENWIVGNIKQTKTVDQALTQSNVTDVNFIQNTLIPLSVADASRGLTNYFLSFRDAGGGKVYVDYEPATVNADSIGTTVTLHYNTSEAPKNYINNAEVIAMNVEVKGSVLMSGMNGLTVQGTTGFTNDDVLTTAAAGGDTSTVGFNYAEGAMNSEVQMLDIGTMTQHDREIYMQQRYDAIRQYTYENHLDVIGNSNIPIGKFIELICIVNGQYHHSSGLYWVTGIVDSIQKGVYMQSLDLVKNANESTYVGQVGAADMISTVVGTSESGWVDFDISYYCACSKCCEKDPSSPSYGITATGTKVKQGRTIAVDPSVIPYKSTVNIQNVWKDGKTHSFVAEDCGGKIKGNKIDVYVDSHEYGHRLGVQTCKVQVVYNGEILTKTADNLASETRGSDATADKTGTNVAMNPLYDLHRIIYDPFKEAQFIGPVLYYWKDDRSGATFTTLKELLEGRGCTNIQITTSSKGYRTGNIGVGTNTTISGLYVTNIKCDFAGSSWSYPPRDKMGYVVSGKIMFDPIFFESDAQLGEWLGYWKDGKIVYGTTPTTKTGSITTQCYVPKTSKYGIISYKPLN